MSERKLATRVTDYTLELDPSSIMQAAKDLGVAAVDAIGQVVKNLRRD